MINAGQRRRVVTPQEINDDWLIDAARRAGHAISERGRSHGVSAWRLLISAGLDDEEILKIACAASGTDPADFSRVSPALSTVLPHAVALEHRVAPIGLHRGILAIGTVNPRSTELERVLAFACKQRVELRAASPSDILSAQGVIYGSGNYGPTLAFEPKGPAMPVAQPPALQPRPGRVSRLSAAIAIPGDLPDEAPSDDPAIAPPAHQNPADAPEALVEKLLASAVAEHASEAHFEPVPEGGAVVRMRVDGKLNDRFRASEANATRIVRTLKSMAGLDPDETRQPQNGRASYMTKHGAITLRLSSEPVGIAHERVILKLYSAQSVLTMPDLGFTPADLHRIQQLLATPDGMIVVAGPPASGKTTTLYAMLRAAQKRDRRTTSVEDNVAYPLEGVEQTEVRTSRHLTRAAAVRATFALGADVVLADVSTDPETMEIILGGAGARHVALTALDATDMASAVERLYELETDVAALSSALRGIVAQRLVRRLCPACAAPQTVSDLPAAQQALLAGLPTDKLRRPVGCAACRGTGFAGRTVVGEIVPMTSGLASAIARRANAAELNRVARDDGVTTLWDAGLHCVLQGITTLGELLDTVPAPHATGATQADQGDIDALLKQLLGSSVMASAPSVTAPATAPADTARAIRVLLVDDDVAARRGLASELRAIGVQVSEAADGEAAIAFAQRLRPDVVITEVALPKLDGIGLVQALAAAGTRPLIVVYTSQDDESLHAWLRDAGASDVVLRPVAADALAHRVRALMS